MSFPLFCSWNFPTYSENKQQNSSKRANIIRFHPQFNIFFSPPFTPKNLIFFLLLLPSYPPMIKHLCMSSGKQAAEERWLEFNEMIFKSREWNFHHSFSSSFAFLCSFLAFISIWLQSCVQGRFIVVASLSKLSFKKIFNFHFVAPLTNE